MVPVAQANSQTAPKRVYLEVVTTALRKLGRSEESITRSIFQDCGDGSLPYDHTGEALPPGFWRTSLSNVKINASDISNVLILPADAGAVGFYTFTLRDVIFDWKDVVAKYPALRGTEPPELGTSTDDTPRHRATYVRNSICAREGQERPQGGRIPWSGH